MGSVRGSRLGKAVSFFIDAEYEEAAYVLGRAQDIMRKRMATGARREPTIALPAKSAAKRAHRKTAAQQVPVSTTTNESAQEPTADKAASA